MKLTKALSLILAIAIFTLSFVGCSSAFDDPEKYVSYADGEKLNIKKSVSISADELKEKLDAQIEEICTSQKGEFFDTTEEAVINGDKVTMTFSAVIEDTSLKADDYSFLKGTDKTIIIGDSANTDYPKAYSKDSVTAKGFEEQIIGNKSGSNEIKFDCIFADDFTSTALQGKKVTYTVKITKVERANIDSKSTVSVKYTPIDSSKEGALDGLTIVTLAPVTEATPTTSTQTSTSAPVTTNAPTTTAVTTVKPTETEPVFANVFTSGELSVGLTEKDGKTVFETETTAFSKVFDLTDLDPSLFLGRHNLDKFTYGVKVTDDIVSGHPEYKYYLNKEVYFTFQITKVERVPEWSDNIANTASSGTYKTTKEYEDAINKSNIKNLAFEQLVDAYRVDKYPKKELQQYYEGNIDSLLASLLSSKDSNFKSIDSYTRKQFDSLVSKEEYDAIKVQAASDAKKTIKQRLVCEALIDFYGIEVTKDYYKTELENEYNQNYVYYYYYIFGAQFTKEQLENYYGKDNFKFQCAQNLMLDKLYEDAKNCVK